MPGVEPTRAQEREQILKSLYQSTEGAVSDQDGSMA